MLIISGSIMGLAVIISSVNQVNDMSETSLNSLAKRYWIVFYAFSKDKIKAYQGTGFKLTGFLGIRRTKPYPRTTLLA